MKNDAPPVPQDLPKRCSSPPTRHPTPDTRHPCDLVPLAWLLLVLAGYALLAGSPLPAPDPKGAVPGLGELDRWVLPALLTVMATGIIRYFVRRARPPRPGDTARAPSLEATQDPA